MSIAPNNYSSPLTGWLRLDASRDCHIQDRDWLQAVRLASSHATECLQAARSLQQGARVQRGWPLAASPATEHLKAATQTTRMGAMTRAQSKNKTTQLSETSHRH